MTIFKPTNLRESGKIKSVRIGVGKRFKFMFVKNYAQNISHQLVFFAIRGVISMSLSFGTEYPRYFCLYSRQQKKKIPGGKITSSILPEWTTSGLRDTPFVIFAFATVLQFLLGTQFLLLQLKPSLTRRSVNIQE